MGRREDALIWGDLRRRGVECKTVDQARVEGWRVGTGGRRCGECPRRGRTSSENGRQSERVEPSTQRTLPPKTNMQRPFPTIYLEGNRRDLHEHAILFVVLSALWPALAS